jgi:hypothetical protein
MSPGVREMPFVKASERQWINSGKVDHCRRFSRLLSGHKLPRAARTSIAILNGELLPIRFIIAVLA